jgi:transcriptional regulator with XRE-family HTH domain
VSRWRGVKISEVIDLRKERLERGLSQYQMAERMGVERDHYAQIERGRHGVTVGMLRWIAEALDCNLYVEFRPRA